MKSTADSSISTPGAKRRMLFKYFTALGSVLTLPSLGLLASRPAGSQTAVKRIYIAADDHTDYLWSADEATYQAVILNTLDHYLTLIDQTATNPSPYQSRWNCDGSLWLWTYEKNKTAAEFNRLMSRVADGHISVPLSTAVSCYGAMPAEAVLRGMYYTGQIERRFGVRFTLMAVAMENQTLPCGLVSLWAGAGAKYSWRGICACASQVPDAGDRRHEIYWWTGLDGNRVLMKWNTLYISNTAIGGYAEANNPGAVIDFVDTNAQFRARYPYNVIAAFGQGGDSLQTIVPLSDQANSFVAVAQAKSNATRQVIVSNETDFFQDFERTYGTTLPSETASYGNEWDLYCASMAEVSASVKRAVEKLRAAEALATLVSLKTASFMTSRIAARDQTWVNLGLYWEHSWTADGNITRTARAAWQRRIAGEISAYVNTLHTDAAVALGQLIAKTGTNQRFYAFNPLSWKRTDIADFPYTGTGPVNVIDLSSGLEMPSQFVTLSGVRYLRILARDVPPVGYKVFEIRAGAGAVFTPAATVTGAVLENSLYKITLTGRGAITSFIDKTRANREFAGNVNGRALNDLGPGTGTLTVENAGPVSVTLRATSTTTLQHTTAITLVRGLPGVRIDNLITQNFSSVQSWGFAFNLTAPDVWHEEVGAIIHAKLQSQGGHYSDRNARYDWLTMNHYVDMSGGGVGVTLANADCYFMKLGNSTTSQLDTTTPLISVLAGGQVDGAALGIPNQGGDTVFRQRFALTTHAALDAPTAMRFALERQNPLVTSVVTGGTAYPDRTFSLLNISTPNVAAWAIKPAEEGIAQGVIVRLWNMGRIPVTGTAVQFLQPVTTAKQTTHIETNLQDVPVTANRFTTSFNAQQMKTYRVNIAS